MKEEHNLDLNNFENWAINEELYLSGHKSSQSMFIEPITYETVYKTCRKFYINAGIDDKLIIHLEMGFIVNPFSIQI